MMERFDRVMKAACDKCVEFNDKHRIGTKVLYSKPGEDRVVATKTTGEAWALHTGVAVVLIEGVGTGVPLDRIEVAPL